MGEQSAHVDPLLELADYIDLGDCIDGHLYRLISRNLAYGVFDASRGGFVGVREKWRGKDRPKARFLFMEFHWDGDSFPTVKPLEDLGPSRHEGCWNGDAHGPLLRYLEGRDMGPEELSAVYDECEQLVLEARRR